MTQRVATANEDVSQPGRAVSVSWVLQSEAATRWDDFEGGTLVSIH